MEALKAVGVQVDFKTYEYMGALRCAVLHCACCGCCSRRRRLRLQCWPQLTLPRMFRPPRAGHEACGEELMEMRDFLKRSFA